MGELGAALSSQVIRTAANLGQYVLPLVLLVGAGLSAVGRVKRKRLLAQAQAATAPNSAKGLTWREFEMLVGEAFRRQGYTVKETRDGADGGVDLELHKGSELSLVQCKHWRALKVGAPVIREFFGVMAARGAAGGYVVTSGTFSKDAVDFADGRNIRLIDATALDRMIREARSVENPRESPRPIEPGTVAAEVAAPACPTCGASMVKRTARKGANAGNQFWGCSRYPQCRGARSV
jgi:restriction system protein